MYKSIVLQCISNFSLFLFVCKTNRNNEKWFFLDKILQFDVLHGEELCGELKRDAGRTLTVENRDAN